MLLRFFLLSKRSNGALRQPIRYERANKKHDIPLRDIEDGLELELAFDGEMFDSKVFLPIIGERLVERPILVLRDVTRVASPNGLGLVELLVDLTLLLDLFLLLLFGFVAFFVVHFFNLGLALFVFSVLVLSFFVLDLFLLIVLDLLRHDMNEKQTTV